MWQLLVPITITSVPGSAAPAPGTPAWASIVAALTGIPAGKPRRCAMAVHSRPAWRPGATIRPGIFWSTSAICGWRERKKSVDGKPSRWCHSAL
jgi:hypothetical protein